MRQIRVQQPEGTLWLPTASSTRSRQYAKGSRGRSIPSLFRQSSAPANFACLDRLAWLIQPSWQKISILRRTGVCSRGLIAAEELKFEAIVIEYACCCGHNEYRIVEHTISFAFHEIEDEMGFARALDPNMVASGGPIRLQSGLDDGLF